MQTEDDILKLKTEIIILRGMINDLKNDNINLKTQINNHIMYDENVNKQINNYITYFEYVVSRFQNNIILNYKDFISFKEEFMYNLLNSSLNYIEKEKQFESELIKYERTKKLEILEK